MSTIIGPVKQKPKTLASSPMRKELKPSGSCENVRIIVAGTTKLIETHGPCEISIGMSARAAGISLTTMCDFCLTAHALFETTS